MHKKIPTFTIGGTHHSLGASIAVAEAASSAVSLGAVWLVGRHPEFIAPVKDFLAQRIICPMMSRDNADESDIQKKAQQKASVLLKGALMIGSSFMAHVPIQMLLEGRYDAQEFKKVVVGKSVGLTAALGSLALIDKAKPGAIEKIEDKISDKIFRCDDGKSAAHCQGDKELCKLMLVDIPASTLSGLANYLLTRRLGP